MKKILFILIICLSFIGYSKTMLHITSVGDMCGVTYYLGIKNNVPVFRGGCVLRGQFFDNLVIIPDYEYINEDYIDLKNNILANNNIIAFRENGNILIDDFSGNLLNWKEKGGISVKFTDKEDERFVCTSSLDICLQDNLERKLIRKEC